MTREARLLSWLSVACTVACALPAVRELWREWQARHTALLEQQQRMRMLVLPAEFTRDLYDSTR